MELVVGLLVRRSEEDLEGIACWNVGKLNGKTSRMTCASLSSARITRSSTSRAINIRPGAKADSFFGSQGWPYSQVIGELFMGHMRELSRLADT